MTRHLTRRPRLLVALLALAVLAGVSTTILSRAGAGTDRCARTAEHATERAALVTGSGAEVLVIGDSYSVGAGVRARSSWPVYLPGRVRVDGFSGSGFTSGASTCGDRSYALRAARSLQERTELVVVEGGLNDTDQPLVDLRTGFAALMANLAGTPVLVVGPPPAPKRAADAVAAVDAELDRLSEEHGATYLSMLDVELSYLDDRLHPDVAGHRVFGEIVAARVAALL